MATYKRDFILSSGIGLSANDIYLSSATNSTTINTGSFITPGGVGIGQSVSLGGRLQLFNNSNYTAFISSASENTVYTLPATSPATGSSVLSSSSGGTLSWVPLVASGGDTYLVNVNAATGNTVLFIAGLNDDIGSGLAVSSNTNLTYDTNTNKLNSPFYTGTWAGSTITTLYGGTGLSAYTKGDLLVGLGDTLYKLPVGTQGQLLQAFSSSTSGLAWTSIMPPTYGAFYSTQTQTVTGVGISTPITLNATFEAYNTQIYGGSGTSSRIQIQTAGTYNIQFSAQMHLTNGTQPKKGDFWFRINGVDVPQSNTQNTISGKDYQTVLALNFISYFAANDYFEIVMSSDDQYFSLEALSGLTSPPRPDISSMIVTVVPVTQVVGSSAGLGVSGIVSINGLNQYVQYFDIGRTGTDFNINSSNFTHTFNIPHAGIGVTGLITSQTQTIGGNKTFANDLKVTSTTISNSISNGALVVSGGVGIGGSLYVASATAISGVAINNGIISGDLIGNVTGFASTSRNINLLSTSSNTPHYLVFSANASGSGVALSTGSSITVNPNSNVLSIGTGTFAANGVSVGSGSNTINTASGNLNIDSFGGQTNLNDNVVISGNLTVQGTTITVDSTVSTFVDPVIVIGSGVGGTHSTLDSNQDRGLEFRWSNSGTATTGFFGFSDLDGKFRFIPQVSSIISSVYTGTAGTAVFTTVEANLSGNSTGTASTYTNFYGTLNGNVIGNVTGNLTGTATTATNVYLAVGANASPHSVIFSPSASGSGVALSTDSSFAYNPNTDTLIVSNITGLATTATYSYQAGYAVTSGTASIATTANYAYQAGYAITSGSASIATTATYAHQSGYAITSGSSSTASTATYAHQAGYAVTSGSASIATSAFNISLQNGLNNTSHSVIFSPTASGSGIALSTNQTVTYNPSTSVLSVSGVAVTSSTNSVSSITGAAIVTGGVGIGQSISVGGRLQLFNSSNYTAFVSSATGNTVYTLPATSPAVGSSVLQSNSAGVLSWVPLVASAAAGNTSQNVFVNAAGTADVFHQVLFTPAQQSAGSAVSSDVLLSFNANSDRLFASGISITSGAASTSPFTGALQVTGGLGVSGQATFARASLGFTGVSVTPVMSFIGATTGPIISLSVLNDNSLSFEGSSGQLFAIDNNLSTGEIFSVSDISGLPIISASAGQTVTINEFGGVTRIGDGTYNAVSTTNAGLVVIGGFGVTGNAFIGGTTTILSGTNSTSPSYGALLISGGVGIGQSVSIGGRLQIFNGSNYSAFVSSATGNTVYTLPATSPAIGSSVLQSTAAGVMSWVPMVAGSSSSGNTSQNVVINAAGNANVFHPVLFTPLQSSSGSAVSSDSTITFNPSSEILNVSGLAVTSLTLSTNTSSGALIVSGGVGIGGSLYVASATGISGVTINNGVVTGNLTGTATTATYAHQAGYAITSGSSSIATTATYAHQAGYAITSGSSSIATTATYAHQSGYAITSGSASIATTALNINLVNGSENSQHRIIFSPTPSGTGVGLSSSAQISYNPSSFILSVSGIAVTSATISNSISTGALIVAGGVGIGGSLYVSSATAISGVTINNGIINGNLAGTATTSRNIDVVVASTNLPHYLLFSPTQNGSGVAVSSGSSITVNPNANVLSIGTGTFAANGVSIGSSPNTITTASGNLNIDSFGGQTNLNDNVVISGNLTVQGTTLTVDSTISTLVDPVIVIGSGVGGTHSTLDDNQDRGIEFRWSNSGTAVTGFFGFSDTDGKFRFIPQVTSLISSVYSGTAGTAVFTTVEANLSGNSTGTASTYTNFYGTFNGNLVGTSTTSINVHLAAGANSSAHSVIFSPNQTGSGVALSSHSLFTYNPNSDTLVVSNITGIATTASYAYQSGYAITSGSSSIATTATYSHQAGYAITSGSASIATTATYAHQAGYAITSGLATTANYSHQSGYAITSGSSSTSGFATTAANLNVSSVVTGLFYPVLSNTASSASGIGASVNSFFTFDASSGAFGATSVNILSGQAYSIGGNSVLSATSLGTGVTNSYLTALGTITTGVWAGTLITGLYGGTGYNSYTKGDILVGAGSTFIKVNVGTDNFVLVADATTASGVKWNSIAGLSITSVNGLTESAQFFSTGTSGTGFNISSSGSTHTFNIPIAGNGATGLVTGIAQTFDGSKTFTSAIIGDLSGTASTANYAHQSGYAITSGSSSIATTAQNVNVVSTNANSIHSLYFGPRTSGSGVALSSGGPLTFNPSSYILSTSGLAVTATTNSTNTTSGALIVSGGVGIGGSVFIDGNVKINFTNHTAFNVADIFTVYGVDNFEGANIKSNYSYAFNVQDESNNNRFTIDVGNNRTILSGNSFSHELRIYNVNQAAYTGFVAASSGTITYTLPGGDGSANNLLRTNGSGVLSWVNISGLALTNINGLTDSYQYLAYDYSGTMPSWASSGSTHTLSIPIASTGATGLVSTQSQSFAGAKTFTNDVFISSSTASTWAANGALRIEGGLGVSGQLSFNQAALGYTGATNPSIAFIGGTTGTPITMTVLSDNSLIFEGTSGKLFGINNNLSSGWIFNVGDISGLPLLRANADGTVAMAEFAGNVGIGLSNPAYKLHVNSSVGFTASTGSTNTTTGALIVTGGVGIGQSVSVGGRLQMFNGSNFTAFVSSASGNTVYTLPSTSPATGSSVLQSTSEGVMSWVPMTSGSSSGTVNSGTANFAAYYASTSTTVSENANLQFTGTGLSVGGNINSTSTKSGALYVNGGLGVTGNAFIGGTTTIQSSVASISSSSGALVASGGVGIGGSLYVANSSRFESNTASVSTGTGAIVVSGGAGIGGSLYVALASRFESSAASIGVGSGAVVVTGGVGIGGSLYTSTGSSSSVSGVVLANGNISATTYNKLTITAPASSATLTLANNSSLITSGGHSLTFNTTATTSLNLPTTGTLATTSNKLSDFAATTSLELLNTITGETGSGALVFATSPDFTTSITTGSATFALFNATATTINAFGAATVMSIGAVTGKATFNSTDNSSSTTTGGLVVSGGAGIAQSISVGGRLQLFNSSNYTAFVSAASGSTTYTLPATSPAIGTSYLVSNSAGVMSWIRPKRSYVLSFGAGFTPTANAADSIQLNIPYAPDNVALNYIVKRVEYRNETVSGGTGLSFYIERHTGGDALWSTAHRIHAGSGASFEVGAIVNQISFTTINSSAGTNGLVASGDYIRLYFTTVGSAANVSISLTIEEQ